jgi:hypothetical protein
MYSLSCMKHLKALDLSDSPLPVHLADTLGRLSQLTSLSMPNVQSDTQWYAAARHRPVVLPSLRRLCVQGEGAVQFLAGTYAPVLTELQELCIPLGTPFDQAHLLGFTAAVLHLCSAISLQGQGQGQEVTAGELRAVVSALATAWQCIPADGQKRLSLRTLHCPQCILALTPATLSSLYLL